MAKGARKSARTIKPNLRYVDTLKNDDGVKHYRKSIRLEPTSDRFSAATAKTVNSVVTAKPDLQASDKSKSAAKPGNKKVDKAAASAELGRMIRGVVADKGRVCTRQELRPKTIRKKRQIRFEIDCSEMAESNSIDVADLKIYFHGHMKVNGKVNNFGDNVIIEQLERKLIVRCNIPVKRSYLKLLTKKYLKKNKLQDLVHVVAKMKTSLHLKYFRITDNEKENAER